MDGHYLGNHLARARALAEQLGTGQGESSVRETAREIVTILQEHNDRIERALEQLEVVGRELDQAAEKIDSHGERLEKVEYRTTPL